VSKIKQFVEDYKSMEKDIRENKENFNTFVQDLYIANCHERSEHGQPIFGSAREYYEEYKDFIKDKYYEKKYGQEVLDLLESQKEKLH
tara:strand:- start:247 stop:510 length:264 start_codon:yes stop_codon:yes gene_type:complete